MLCRGGASHRGLVVTNPIEHMRLERMAGGDVRMEELIGWFVVHADLRHDTTAWQIDCSRDGDDLRCPQSCPCIFQHCMRSLCCQPLTPDAPCKLPSDLQVRMRWNCRLECGAKTGEAQHANERSVMPIL